MVKQVGKFLVELPAGQFVFHQGDAGEELFIIHRGEIEILDESESPSRRIALLEKGDFFGEMSLLEDQPRLGSARAVSDASLVKIGRSTFDRMLRDDPEIAVRIMRKLSRRLREAQSEVRRRQREESTGAMEAERAAPPPSTAAGAHLLHAVSGALFALNLPETLIGRRDPVTGIRPQIDLSAVDPERSCSRRHAKIVVEEGSYFVVEDIGTTNGTFVNGERIRAGVRVAIAPGDTIRFGLVDLDLQAD